MIGLLAGMALAASAQFNCLTPDKADIVVEQKIIGLGANERMEAVSISHHGNGALGFDGSRLVIYAADCQIMFEHRFDQMPETHFALSKLGKQSVLIVSAQDPSGTGCDYQHLILAYGRGDLTDVRTDIVALAPMDLSHSNMDGFYIGDLGRGRGDGLALWQAIWDREAHYEPHRYRVTTYRWREGRFVGPKIVTTLRKYAPDPDGVAKRLGFTFRDATQPKQFTLLGPGEC